MMVSCNLQIGKFNIEVQSVDRCDLNNLYQKTPVAIEFTVLHAQRTDIEIETGL